MTALDPRLEEIAANVSRAESRDYPSFVIATTHAAYLLAELRKAQDKLARVEGVCDEWEMNAGPGTRAAEVYGPQKVSVEFAVKSIRAAVADATGGGDL